MTTQYRGTKRKAECSIDVQEGGKRKRTTSTSSHDCLAPNPEVIRLLSVANLKLNILSAPEFDYSSSSSFRKLLQLEKIRMDKDPSLIGTVTYVACDLIYQTSLNDNENDNDQLSSLRLIVTPRERYYTPNDSSLINQQSKKIKKQLCDLIASDFPKLKTSMDEIRETLVIHNGYFRATSCVKEE